MTQPFLLTPLKEKPQHTTAAVKLYTDAFPEAERRTPEEWRKQMETKTDFCVMAVTEGELFEGFISFWDLRNFVYVEHFAVRADIRGKGIGGRIFEELKKQAGKRPVVLEVELPDNDMARKRIAFYERHGLNVVDRNYRQPPYRKGETALTLLIMTTDTAFAENHFDEIRDSIYTNVYGVGANDSF